MNPNCLKQPVAVEKPAIIRCNTHISKRKKPAVQNDCCKGVGQNQRFNRLVFEL